MIKPDPQKRYEVQHDLLFTDAVKFGGYIGTPEIKNAFLHRPWKSFQHNVESVLVMVGIPQAVASSAVGQMLMLAQATFDALGKPVLDNTDLDSSKESVNRALAAIEKGFLQSRREVHRVLTDDVVKHNKSILVNSWLTKPGYFALLEAQILGVWGAFDTLLADICVAVVNEKPELLQGLGEKQATLNELLQRMGGHDWSGRMGEIVRVFVRFDSLKATKATYKQIFGSTSISEIVSSEAIAVACLIRNLLTHDSGLVTANFLRQAKTEPWKSCVVDERLPLTGRNVADLCEGLIHCANDLIRAVDDWFHSPPSVPTAK